MKKNKTKKTFNKQKFQKAVSMMLDAFGEDTKREGIKRTPERVAEFYEEFFDGYNEDIDNIISVHYQTEEYEEIVIVKDIQLYSMCEHHLLPFSGKVHIAYLPKKGRIVGVSKLVRVVEAFAHRLQLQERLSEQIADTIMKTVQPKGAMVVIEAEHLCMTMRGVRKPGAKMITSAMRGIFLKDARTRSEALSLLK
ncbi:MAG: GTP cyclohydrolase I FolE [Elusimicrobia bacterium]|jgi:GTP cyclohydrolase I|nr:GTP cyclohydrolase I FolE [Elusimicrobiota bacterium]MBQ2219989.1 GTP cyclohydrolase I FolE [Elusimicrobiota bacterium]MBQ4179052.1 GTP cyclohydrolase I FolE [Elusimicrobiota bacterium]